MRTKCRNHYWSGAHGTTTCGGQSRGQGISFRGKRDRCTAEVGFGNGRRTGNIVKGRNVQSVFVKL